MKLKNISKDEQKLMPADGPAFSVAAGELTPKMARHTAEDLLASFPDVWAREHTDDNHKPKKKEGAK